MAVANLCAPGCRIEKLGDLLLIMKYTQDTLAATTAKGASSRFRILSVILDFGVHRCKLKRVSRGSSSYMYIYIHMFEI